jgi:ketosteroid isomerase-like protein
MDPEKPTSGGKIAGPGSTGPAPQDPVLDDLFRQLTQDMSRPKPSADAVAAAVQTIQRLAVQTDLDQAVSAVAQSSEFRPCRACGSLNPPANRFCSICGVPLGEVQEHEPRMPNASTEPIPSHHPGVHQYHHHYHHHYFYSEGASSIAAGDQRVTASIPTRDARMRASQAGPSSLSRAEVALRKITQDWALACNSKHLDDLVSLYTADAILLRSNVPAVRGAAAIREYFFSVLDAGLGDVETEPLRVEVFGDLGYEAGRGQMLVPVAMNKRREERGKYVFLLMKQSGDWKIVVDCWASDLTLIATAEAGPAKSQIPSQPNPALRPPRKGP